MKQTGPIVYGTQNVHSWGREMATISFWTQLKTSFQTDKPSNTNINLFYAIPPPINVTYPLYSDVEIFHPHSVFSVTFHPPGGGGRREGGRSEMERSCWSISLSSWPSSLSSLFSRSPLILRAVCFFSLLESHSSMLRPGIILSTEPSLCLLSSSTCLFKLNRSSSDMWENLQFGPKSQIPFWRNFLQGFFVCSSYRMAEESLK